MHIKNIKIYRNIPRNMKIIMNSTILYPGAAIPLEDSSGRGASHGGGPPEDPSWVCVHLKGGP